MSKTIPISAVNLDAEAEQLVLEVIRSGHLVQGPMVERLETAFADLCGVRHAVAVSSGTTALIAAIKALGVGPGDEVITSPFTFVATLNAILESGASARFADIDASSFTIDPRAIHAQVSERTRAVLPVHLYGQPADMARVVSAAKRVDAAIIEDAAQAHGAELNGRAVGSFGVACFSLYATKHVTTGEGGIVATDDDAVADRVRLLRNHGMRGRYEYELPGNNLRLTDLQAALGLPQMKRLGELNDTRRRHAAYLSQGLADIPGLVTPELIAGRTHVFHQYTVRITTDARLDRDTLHRRLSESGVQTGIYYPKPVYDYECFRSHSRVHVEPMPEAERAAKEVLSLPVHPELAEQSLDRIVELVHRLLGV